MTHLGTKNVCEQFISSVTAELRTFIKELSCPSLADVVKCAENHGAAHPSVYKGIGNKNSPKKPVDSATKEEATSNFKGNASTSFKCFTCGNPNPSRKNCPKRNMTLI